jgi:hypothetical protein
LLGPVVAPSGEYLVTAPIVVQSVQGLQFEGAGMESTFFVPDGTFDSVFEFDGLAYSRIGGFTITSGETHDIDTAIKIEWTAAAYRSTTQNEFHQIYLRNLTTRAGFGIGVDSSANQVDMQTFYKCVVAGTWTVGEGTDWQVGFESGNGTNGNTLAHDFIGCTVTAWARGVLWNASSGNWWGGAIGFNGIDFYVDGGNSQISINNVRSETSERFLSTGGPAGSSRQMTINNVNWIADALDSPYVFMYWKLSGGLVLNNVSVTACGGEPRLELQNGKPLAVTLTGCALEVAAEDLIVDNGSGGYSALFLSYANLMNDTDFATVISFYQEGDAVALDTGFFGAVPTGQPTITGARDDGTALADLLTELATLGLIVDSTTAT